MKSRIWRKLELDRELEIGLSKREIGTPNILKLWHTREGGKQLYIV
jgi:hypothetical protein